jgi:hypothetical protein
MLERFELRLVLELGSLVSRRLKVDGMGVSFWSGLGLAVGVVVRIGPFLELVVLVWVIRMVGICWRGSGLGSWAAWVGSIKECLKDRAFGCYICSPFYF